MIDLSLVLFARKFCFMCNEVIAIRVVVFLSEDLHRGYYSIFRIRLRLLDVTCVFEWNPFPERIDLKLASQRWWMIRRFSATFMRILVNICIHLDQSWWRVYMLLGVPLIPFWNRRRIPTLFTITKFCVHSAVVIRDIIALPPAFSRFKLISMALLLSRWGRRVQFNHGSWHCLWKLFYGFMTLNWLQDEIILFRQDLGKAF